MIKVMAPTRKKKDNGIWDRPNDQQSILVAFAKQGRMKKCQICKEEIASGMFTAHQRECKVREDDEECQILFSQTAEEKWATGTITLDDEGNELKVKRERKEENEDDDYDNPGTSTQGPSRTQLKKRRMKGKNEEIDWKAGREEIKEAEETIRRRDSPVRTRRSTLIAIQKTTMMEDDTSSDTTTQIARRSEEIRIAMKESGRKDRGESKDVTMKSDEDERNHLMEVFEEEVNVLEVTMADPSPAVSSIDSSLNSQMEEERVVTPSVEQMNEVMECPSTIRVHERRSRRLELGPRRNEENKEGGETPQGLKELNEEGELPLDKLMVVTLKTLEDKVTRHERGMMSSQEIVNAPVITIEDEDPELVPHYVYLICKIMKRVLTATTDKGIVHDERFWGEDLRLMANFLSQNDDAKLLFIRLLTRKRAWHLPEKLDEKYHYLKGRVIPALKELATAGLLETSKTCLSDTSEALRLLPIIDLKKLAKEFRVDHNRPRHDLISSLMSKSSTQKALFTQNSPNIQGRLLKQAKCHLGLVYRTSSHSNLVFRSLFTLYSPALSDSTLIIDDRTINILSNMMFRMKEIHYSTSFTRAPFPCPIIAGMYSDKEDLFRFVQAKEDEETQLRALDKHDGMEALKTAEEARERLAEVDEERATYLLSLPSHLRPFTREAVLTRIVLRGVECLERNKEHAAAVNWHNFILNSQLLHSLSSQSIGSIYERIALNLHFHCKEPEEAIDKIAKALDDPLVPDKNRLNLEDRARRIMKDKWKTRLELRPPIEVTIEGETIGRDLGDERKNRFVRKSDNGDIAPISVEEVAKDHFLSNGMQHGVHTEGELWHLIFHLLFYSVIFDDSVQDAWMCELQSHPLDLNYSLYERRKESFDERLQYLKENSVGQRARDVAVNWNKIEHPSNLSLTQVQSFLSVCPLSVILLVCETLMKNHRHRRSGFPDLVLWNGETGRVILAEVKGPGDSLSPKQRLWLHDLSGTNEVDAIVCRVTASGRKRIHNTQQL